MLAGPVGPAELCRGGAEVRVSKQDAAEEPGLVHAHHRRDGNESADAADSCQMECFYTDGTS